MGHVLAPQAAAAGVQINKLALNEHEADVYDDENCQRFIQYCEISF